MSAERVSRRGITQETRRLLAGYLKTVPPRLVETAIQSKAAFMRAAMKTANKLP